MKRILAAWVAVPLLVGVLVLSRYTPAGTSKSLPEQQAKQDIPLHIKQEALNPWNNLKFNNDAKTFRFAIVSDRTGGARPGIFERAVDQLNLLQPEFVVSVGDLIQGYTEDQDKLTKQWKEFNGFIAKLEMPFFYVVGNHDITNEVQEKRWQEQFGRLWYHFKYKDVLFVLLNTEDLPGKKTTGKFGPKQIEEVKKTLKDNQDVRWTMVFLHRPVWHMKDLAKVGWLEIEEALKGRPYTVIAGHEHKYVREVRNGSRYYTLATTGGDSKLRGTTFGEFDHIVWVTMKNDGPMMVNLMMEGIFAEDVRTKDKK